MLRTLLIVIVVALLALGGLAVRTLIAAGSFRTVESAYAGTCRRIVAPAGSEDIALDRARGLLYLSAIDRRAVLGGASEARGEIFLMQLAALEEGPLPLTGTNSRAPDDFRPHGISLYTDGQGRQTLMAINHPAAGGHTVEIFDVVPGAQGGVALRHRRTVGDPLLVNPNDLHAVGPDSFYATNDHGAATGGFWQALETYLVIPWANVVHFDGRAMRVVASGLTFANGIAGVDGDGRILVAETSGRTLSLFDRDAASGALTLRQALFLGTGLDNIDVAPDGTVLVAAHPQLLALGAHAADKAALSPSEVLRLVPAGGSYQSSSIFLDTGETISGISTAIETPTGELLLSNIFDPYLVVCTPR